MKGNEFLVTGNDIIERAMNMHWRQNSANGKWHFKRAWVKQEQSSSKIKKAKI